jgi:outer membrane protein TolC
MKRLLRRGLVLTTLVVSGPLSAWAADQVLGADVDSLLEWAKQHNPDVAAMRHELTAATERPMPAGALAAPRFKMELQDVTQSGSRAPALWPNDAGGTLYSLTQDFPWLGKRDLKRDIAHQEAEVAQGRVKQTWTDTAARIKTMFVQRYLIQANQRLVSENLDLMLNLEKVLQVRYAGGLTPQQDITRIHVEHTGMRSELVALGLEWQQTQTRLNAMLARPLELHCCRRRSCAPCRSLPDSRFQFWLSGCARPAPNWQWSRHVSSRLTKPGT